MITAIPPGDAPHSVRLALKGTQIPLAGDQSLPAFKLKDPWQHDPANEGGYVVRGSDAVQALRNKSADLCQRAAAWLAEMGYDDPEEHLVFNRQCCWLIHQIS